MSTESLNSLFSLEGQVAVVTGGTGALGGLMAQGLAGAGAKVAVLGRNQERMAQVVKAVKDLGADCLALTADVTKPAELTLAANQVLEKWGRLDILVNAAGGNVPAATIPETATFFDLAPEAFNQVMDLNLVSTVLASQIFGKAMSQTAKGCIINISSMAATQAITRVVGYSAAKAAVDNFTRWLAVELARKFGANMRVNAIAPGFFIGEQNYSLLINPAGELTDRGKRIVERTPMGRFGKAQELVSTLIWLCSPGASFVTGIVVPVDGGFSAFSGV